MKRELKRAVDRARERLAQNYGDRAAWASLYEAERHLAAARGDQWAEAIDLDAQWDTGAPLPHLVSNGSRAVLICHAADPDPNWDGSYVTSVSPSDPQPSKLLEFTFERCHSIRFGGPNDEALSGHPLHGRGLEGYTAHVIHNSRWIADEEAINSVHSSHRGGWHERLRHFLFVFHDEMFEALAASVQVERVHGVLSDRLVLAAASIVEN